MWNGEIRKKEIWVFSGLGDALSVLSFNTTPPDFLLSSALRGASFLLSEWFHDAVPVLTKH